MAKGAAPWLLGIFGLAMLSVVFHLVGWGLANGIYFATALVVLWYTIETRNMRFEMARQNDMAVRPLLVTGIEVRSYESKSGSRFQDELLVIRNIGRGPALSVQIEDIETDLLRVAFETVNVMPSDAIENVRATVYVEGRLAYDEPTAFVASLKSNAPIPYRLTVRYRDVTGQPHFSVMTMGKDGTRLLEHSGVKV